MSEEKKLKASNIDISIITKSSNKIDASNKHDDTRPTRPTLTQRLFSRIGNNKRPRTETYRDDDLVDGGCCGEIRVLKYKVKNLFQRKK